MLDHASTVCKQLVILEVISQSYVLQATAVEKTYTSEFQYSCTSYFSKNLIGVKRNQTAAELCPTPQDFQAGSAVVAYNSTSFYDDLLWSSAWLWHLTGML